MSLGYKVFSLSLSLSAYDDSDNVIYVSKNNQIL